MLHPISITRTFLFMLVCTIVFLPGCQTTTTGPAVHTHDTLRPGDLPGEMTSPGTGQKISPDELTAKDRCPARLHDIVEALFTYYVIHKQMPEKLDDLRGVTKRPLEFICPDTNLPYTYVPVGLRKPGGTKRIIVHDSALNPQDGTRWCIVMADTRPGAGMSAEVVQMPEPIFLAYQ
jgi:hypothetical protein